MPKYAFLNAHFRGKSVTIHSFGTRREKDAFIEHWMPPSAAGKDATVGEPRATYAHATAHMRCSLPYHAKNKRLRSIDCAPILAHSRVLGAQLDQSASGQRRMDADYTETLGWNTCTSLK